MPVDRPITLVIPGLPKAKGRPRIGLRGNGRPVAFTPAETRTREGVVAALAMAAMAGRAALIGPVEVTVEAVMPIPVSKSKAWKEDALKGRVFPAGRPDLDNLVKLVSDALNGIVWGDDAQIVFLLARKLYGVTPRTIVRVCPVTP